MSEWLEEIHKELKAPWWKRMYDYVGLIGHLIPGRWTRKLNIPWLKYCSERVAPRIRKFVKIFIPSHSNPSEINAAFKKHPEKIELLGYWFND